MRLYAYAETFWPLGLVLDRGPTQGVFASVPRGRDWLAKSPPEVRKWFSQMGLQALSEQGTNWHRLGGLARAATARRGYHGRFV